MKSQEKAVKKIYVTPAAERRAIINVIVTSDPPIGGNDEDGNKGSENGTGEKWSPAIPLK